MLQKNSNKKSGQACRWHWSEVRTNFSLGCWKMQKEESQSHDDQLNFVQVCRQLKIFMILKKLGSIQSWRRNQPSRQNNNVPHSWWWSSLSSAHGSQWVPPTNKLACCGRGVYLIVGREPPLLAVVYVPPLPPYILWFLSHTVQRSTSWDQIEFYPFSPHSSSLIIAVRIVPFNLHWRRPF